MYTGHKQQVSTYAVKMVCYGSKMIAIFYLIFDRFGQKCGKSLQTILTV